MLNGAVIYILFSLQSHTILLIQPTAKPESRIYSDYETKDECMEGRQCPA